MSRIVSETLQDLRGGRQSWRVYAVVGLPAFVAGVFNTLIRIG